MSPALPAAYAYRKLTGTDTGVLRCAEPALHNPVFQRMEGDNAKPSARLQLVDQSAKILQKHIESITDLRKYDNGEVRLHVVEIDFSRFVEEICLLFQPIARSRGYEFAVRLNPLSQKVFIDKDSIEKVILNLMSNAVKYSPDRGGADKC